MPQTLAEMAVDVLTTADGREKTALSRRHAARWREARAAGAPLPVGTASPPDFPARPARPVLRDPRDVPRRRPGSPEGRIALLHAVAHIELNAVDLHWDIIARFAHVPMPPGFYDDWVKAADEESKHFNLICDLLEGLAHYTTQRDFLIFGVAATGEMDSEHGVIPCQDFFHDPLFSRRSAEDAKPTCAPGQDPSRNTLPSCAWDYQRPHREFDPYRN